MGNEAVRLDVALVHAPVLNRRGETIGSAVTNLDLHDIARACRTYGVDTYWLITPYPRQQELVRELAGHWLRGVGRDTNPDRGEALALMRIVASLEEAVDGVKGKWGAATRVLGTSARPDRPVATTGSLRRELNLGHPMMLVFGTGWGLAPEIGPLLDGWLAPIDPGQGYNHLSVRSAVSIYLDRLLGERDG